MDDKNSPKVCLDASVIGKLLIKEKNSGEAISLFKIFTRQHIGIIEPTFLKIETYSILRKKSHFKEVSKKQIKEIIALFEALKLEYFLENRELLSLSYSLAEQLDQPVIYDSLYLALAKKENAPFITADMKFLKKAKKIYQNSFSLKSFFHEKEV